MTETDKKLRATFCRKVYRHKLGPKFWRKDSFYFDGTYFVCKKNPLDQALASEARERRMRSERLTVVCTTKEKKEGNQQAHSME